METLSGSHTSDGSEWSADELIPFGKYILLERIASGATAAVYRANVRGEAGFERLVAIKRILPHMAGDPEFVNTFVREAKTTARLTHENICPIYELGKVGESLYMAMECIVGKDLRRIKRKVEQRGEIVPPINAAWLAARVCDALDYAHSLRDQSGNNIGIIHRDLSPTNIVISYEGQVKLIDFGLAKAVGRAQQTNVDALKRKLGYMSPEMVRGKPVDARSDIFGVGIALYEMLTGRRLFAGKDDIATLKAVGKASVPPPSALLEDPPEDLELIIMRALERDPDDRWQTAAEMSDVLNAFIRSQDPTFGERNIRSWIENLFGDEIDADRRRIARLLRASADPEVVAVRRRFFASSSGAAARAKAEVARRAATTTTVPPAPAVPAEAASPWAQGGEVDSTRVADPPLHAFKEAEAAAQGDESSDRAKVKTTPPPRRRAKKDPFEEEPTAFYEGADPVHDEATAFYEPAGEHTGSNGAAPGFEDEKTEFLDDEALDEMATETAAVFPAEQYGVGPAEPGFDEEEPTQIYFNKEEGVGMKDMLAEINDVEPQAGPLNRPIIAPDIAIAPPGAAVAPPASVSARPSQMPSGRYRGRTTVEVQHGGSSRWTWPTVGVAALLLAALVYLLLRTPAGVQLGLIKPAGGVIELRTEPAVGAAVSLDGVYRGQTPLRMSGVQPGSRNIKVEAEGYEPIAQSVSVRADETSIVVISLRPEAGAGVEPDPVPATEDGDEPEADSEAEADGDNGATSGTSRKRSRRSSARAQRRKAMAEAAEPSSAKEDDQSTPGTLVVNSVPWAQVFLDGRDIGRTTPLFGLPLSPGPHVVGLRTKDGRLHSERIMVEPGQPARVSHRF